MEVQYKTDLYSSYMLIKIPSWINQNQYTFKMLERNRMQGILSSKERIEDGQAFWYVDITGKKNLIQEYIDKEMELEDMISFFQQLILIFDELRNYLLTEKMILLEPEFVYKDSEDGSLWLTILPWEREEISLHKLAEFFLEKMNHRDEHGVNAAYHFYRQQSQPHFSLYQFLPVLEKENILKRQKQKEKSGAVYPYDQTERNEFINEHKEELTEKLYTSDLEEINSQQKPGVLKKLLGRIFPFHKKREVSNTNTKRNKNEDNLKEEKAESSYMYEETVFFESKDTEDMLKLQWKEKGRTKQYTLENFPVTAGKMKEEVSLVIGHPSVSRIHCRFVEQNGGIAIIDMDSTNGTFLNGMRLKQGEILEIVKNDEILIGKVKLLVV